MVAIVLIVGATVGIGVYLQMNRITEGRIYEKEFEPAHTEWRTVTTGKNTTSMPVSIPDKWFIRINNVGEDGKVREWRYRVGEIEYERVKLGDYWCEGGCR